MLFLKSILLACSVISASSTPALAATIKDAPVQHCYSVTITINIEHVGDVDTTLETCANTPEESLRRLGVAVRALGE